MCAPPQRASPYLSPIVCHLTSPLRASGAISAARQRLQEEKSWCDLRRSADLVRRVAVGHRQVRCYRQPACGRITHALSSMDSPASRVPLALRPPCRGHVARPPPAVSPELTVCDATALRRRSAGPLDRTSNRWRLHHRAALPRPSLGHPHVRMRAARAPERALRVAQPPQPSHPPIPHPYAAQRRQHAPSTPRDHTTLGRPRVGRSSKVPFDLAQGRGRRSAAASRRRHGPGRPGACSGTRGVARGPRASASGASEAFGPGPERQPKGMIT